MPSLTVGNSSCMIDILTDKSISEGEIESVNELFISNVDQVKDP